MISQCAGEGQDRFLAQAFAFLLAKNLEGSVNCRHTGVVDENVVAIRSRSLIFNLRSIFSGPRGADFTDWVEPWNRSPRYGTYNRSRHFPEVKWHHLLLAAPYVAAAFDSLHAAHIVVGDVNQANLWSTHKCESASSTSTRFNAVATSRAGTAIGLAIPNFEIPLVDRGD
jgi:hypothetical protein